ncbi:MAG: hypothetical protein L0Z51_00100 [Candidatus Latescibacteria bacterium]|nr:hypothetical protein [Candidatus Latescibacterota bacterium]
MMYELLTSLTIAITIGNAEPPWITEMRYCDIVVRGRIVTADVEMKPRNEALPMMPGNPDSFLPVAMVRVSVEEVLRGDWTRDTVDFVSFVSISGFKSNYEPGQDIFVGLVWGETVLGGSYWLNTEAARFVRRNEGWVWQGDGVVLADLSELITQLQETSPTRVLEKSDAAVTGIVSDVRLSTIAGAVDSRAVQMSIFLERVVWFDGHGTETKIVVRQLMSGDYWPDWRDSAPWREMPAIGKEYCVFLKRIADGYAVFGGINGTFEVRGDQLYFAGRSRVGVTTRDVRQIAIDKR